MIVIRVAVVEVMIWDSGEIVIVIIMIWLILMEMIILIMLICDSYGYGETVLMDSVDVKIVVVTIIYWCW